MTAPAPAAVPLRAATMGLRRARMFLMRSQVIRVKSTSPGMSRWNSSPMMLFTSPPEQKPRPSPVMTTLATSGSRSSAKKRSVSSR